MKEQARARGGVRRTVGAFALGTAIGGIVALLFAPCSGRETRRQIRLKTQALRRNAEELRETAAERFAVARTWVLNHVPNGHAKRLPRRRHPANA